MTLCNTHFLRVYSADKFWQLKSQCILLPLQNLGTDFMKGIFCETVVMLFAFCFAYAILWIFIYEKSESINETKENLD